MVGGLGIEKLNSLMPDIVSSAEKADIQPHVRDGYLMMYIYLPSGMSMTKKVGAEGGVFWFVVSFFKKEKSH